jgi:tRNA A-37 threonylcarbamoyl transferase component Bud32
MVDVLALLHQVDVCHYDIKDDNWVLAEGCTDESTAHNANTRLCLIDFGIAQDLLSDMTINENQQWPTRRTAKEV